MILCDPCSVVYGIRKGNASSPQQLTTPPLSHAILCILPKGAVVNSHTHMHPLLPLPLFAAD